MRPSMAAAALIMMATTSPALVQPAQAQQSLADQLVGSWRLVSIQAQFVGESGTHDLLGPNPIGRVIYSADRHFVVFFSRSDRKPPTNDAEAAALLRSMLGYTGRFRIEGNQITSTFDGAWTEVYRQGEQVRTISIEGDTLTVRSPPQPSGMYPGKTATTTAVLVRERAE